MTTKATETTWIHIHAPQPSRKKIAAAHCHDCERRSWFVGFFTDWYGWDVTCLRCGRNWQDGEWMALPFMRGARQHSIDMAKRRWRQTEIADEVQS